jgi:hypothetical protein
MNTNSLLRTVSTLSVAALLTTNVLAGPGPRTSPANSEPDRIFNEETGNFEPNPDYHEPAPVAPVRHRGQAAEPRRIFDLAKGDYVINPDYHEPAPARQAASSTKQETEPARIFDTETGNFEPNPDYHEPAPVAAARQGERVAGSRRVFDALTRNFKFNPSYHASVSVRRNAHSAKSAPQSARNFDAETGDVGPNPLVVHRL